jgi:hypothetical protein
LKRISFSIRAGLDYIATCDTASQNLVDALANPVVDDDFRAEVFAHFTPKEKSREIKREPKPTFIYLMLDENTGHHKIGKSIKPSYREKTLQSEKSSIVLISTWNGTDADEISLHKLFHQKRVRGEWFALTDSDIEQIRNHFKGTK